MRDMGFSGFAGKGIANPANRLFPKQLFQFGLPPGVIGLRSMFEDMQTIDSAPNPVKWEDPMVPIGKADGDLPPYMERPMISDVSRLAPP